MSTHMPGFRSFFRFFASFCKDQINLPAALGLIAGSLVVLTYVGI